MISVSGCSRLTMKASKTSVIISNQHNKTQLSTRYTMAHSTTYYVHCSKSNRVLKAIEPAPRSFLQLPPFAKFYASSRRKVTDWLLCSNYYVLCTMYVQTILLGTFNRKWGYYDFYACAFQYTAAAVIVPPPRRRSTVRRRQRLVSVALHYGMLFVSKLSRN